MLERPKAHFTLAATMQAVQSEFPQAAKGVYFYDLSGTLGVSEEADRVVQAMTQDFPKIMKSWSFARNMRALMKHLLRASGAVHYPIPDHNGVYFAHYLKPQIPGSLSDQLMGRLFDAQTLHGQDIAQLKQQLEKFFTYHDLGHLLECLNDPGKRPDPAYIPASMNSRRWKEEKIADTYAVLHFFQNSADLDHAANVSHIVAAGRDYQTKTSGSRLYDTATVIKSAIAYAYEAGLPALHAMSRRQTIETALALAATPH